MKTTLRLVGFFAAVCTVYSQLTCNEIQCKKHDVRKVIEKYNDSVVRYRSLQRDSLCAKGAFYALSDEVALFILTSKDTCSNEVNELYLEDGEWIKRDLKTGFAYPRKTFDYLDDGDNSFMCVFTCDSVNNLFKSFDCYVIGPDCSGFEHVDKAIEDANIKFNDGEPLLTCDNSLNKK